MNDTLARSAYLYSTYLLLRMKAHPYPKTYVELVRLVYWNYIFRSHEMSEYGKPRECPSVQPLASGASPHSRLEIRSDSKRHNFRTRRV